MAQTESNDHIRDVFTSGNGVWQGKWDFYPEGGVYTVTQISAGYKYWEHHVDGAHPTITLEDLIWRFWVLDEE